jgi:ketosteroid isomerase-like protein
MAVSEAPVANGKAAIEQTLGRMVAVTDMKAIDSRELVVHGDDAYDYGTYQQTVKTPAGKSVDQNGYYIVTLHRGADGQWKITRHLGVQPPPAR